MLLRAARLWAACCYRLHAAAGCCWCMGLPMSDTLPLHPHKQHPRSVCPSPLMHRPTSPHSTPTPPHTAPLPLTPLPALLVLQLKGPRSPFRLLHETLADSEFLNYRPSGRWHGQGQHVEHIDSRGAA
jgi:hypothetical protein